MHESTVAGIEAWLDEDPLHELHQLKIERAESGKRLIDLSMVNPDIPVSQEILDRMLEASVKPVNSRYSVSRGIRKLRQAFSDKYRVSYQVVLNPETEICVTMGAKDALFQLLFTLGLSKKAGKAVLLAPAYPAHYSALMLSGYSVEIVPDFQKEEDILNAIRKKVDEGARLAILNFPQNPGGRMVSRAFLKTLVDLSRSSGLTIIHDFAYGEFCYREDAMSFLSMAEEGDEIYEIYSLSKTYSVPGWRVASLSGKGGLLSTFIKVKSHLDYGLFLPIQHAAAYALSIDSSVIHDMKTEYRFRAETLVQGLQRLGWKVAMPDGGCSVWAQYPEGVLPHDSIEAALFLLRECGVAVLPGSYFPGAGERFFRFALVKPQEVLQQVISMLEELESFKE